MAKNLYMSDNEIDEILAALKKQLSVTKHFGEIEIKKEIDDDKRTATVFFTANAWNKLFALVSEFDTEVQWHGLVKRLSESEFEIYDILTFPHKVTGATVTSDLEEYQKWLDNLDDDTFNSLHFHGHSHVNMNCSPSSTDMKYRHDLVTQLPAATDEDDVFYIFLIFNKKNDWTGEIYDIKYNALYSTNDIDVEIYCGDDYYLSDFIAKAKKQAVKETVGTTKKDKSTKKSYNADSYWSGGNTIKSSHWGGAFGTEDSDYYWR